VASTALAECLAATLKILCYPAEHVETFFIKKDTILLGGDLQLQAQEEQALVEIENLSVVFQTHRGLIKASHDINIKLYRGQTMGIVGESGSGKSVSMMAYARLLPEYAHIGGSMRYQSVALEHLSDREFYPYRGKKILYLFQDPLSALNPYLRVGKQLYESICLHEKLSKEALHAEALHLLRKVDLDDGERILRLYPHQCSGGMRQRILLALALALKPEVLIADEPTSALDASSAAQIIQLLHTLQQRDKLSIILISHDLTTIKALAQRIAVFYQGTIVEQGQSSQILSKPSHPYTQKLLDAMHQMY
jgi:ABC-type dipeptide/oligopeptide/nickel transport system ATPase component